MKSIGHFFPHTSHHLSRKQHPLLWSSTGSAGRHNSGPGNFPNSYYGVQFPWHEKLILKIHILLFSFTFVLLNYNI